MILHYNFVILGILYLITSWATLTESRGLSAHIDETPTMNLKRPTPEAYNAMRNMFFRHEESTFFGSDLQLTDNDLAANQKLMEVKIEEYNDGLKYPYEFAPSQHFFSVLPQIEKSPLFAFIEKMPKGGVLHAHETALCSTEFILKLTYRDKLWGKYCDEMKKYDISELKFANIKPKGDNLCDWDLLANIRQSNGADHVDNNLKQKFSLYPSMNFLDNNAAWRDFMKIFTILDGLLTYAPVWADYYYNALEEFQADGVQYLEFRTTLPKLYDLDGLHNYTELDTVRIYVETLNKFMALNPNFIGSKLIYAPIRVTDKEGMDEYIKICLEIKEKYPHFVAGFDLVGQEESGGALKEFIPQLLSMPENIDFYFHAGETNWFGSSVDENLVDAILLNAKRIGHGFAAIKHPQVLKLIKERKIAIEVNPISNQILKLIDDFRNHPASHLFADNYPLVVSSDDPSLWMAKPLSHDFYIAFLGIASAHADIRMLKQLAINSITYSSLTAGQKIEAFQKWQAQWDQYIANIINGESNAAEKRLKTNKLE